MDSTTNAILIATNGLPISLNMACKILHKGKKSVRQMIGTSIGVIKVDKGNSFALNLADVLNLTRKAI